MIKNLSMMVIFEVQDSRVKASFQIQTVNIYIYICLNLK